MQQDAGGGGGGGGDGNSMHLLLSILADGEEQARRLLGELPPADDDEQLLGRGPAAECCRGVAEQLLCTVRKAIAVAKAIEAAGGDSPRSADEGAGATAAGMAGRDAAQERQGHGVCKRRKGLPRWTEKFRIPDDANLEYTPDDGFSWRKYGQKDILGAKFPRGYYRCTYRNAQGCAATRQVQRSDADLAVFDVTYQGAHTCLQAQRRAAAPPPPPPPPPAAHDVQRSPPALQDPEMQLLENFRNGLKVEIDGLPPPPPPCFHGDGTTAFSFAYAAAGAAGYSPAGSGGQQLLQGGGCFAPASFSSPAATTSAGPGYFSVSAAHCTLGTHDSPELAEVVSAATASDPAGFDYSLYQYHDLQQHDLDAHLPFPFDPMFGHPSSSHGQHRDA